MPGVPIHSLPDAAALASTGLMPLDQPSAAPSGFTTVKTTMAAFQAWLLPANVSAFANDVPYLTSASQPGGPVSQFANDVPYLSAASSVAFGNIFDTSLPVGAVFGAGDGTFRFDNAITTDGAGAMAASSLTVAGSALNADGSLLVAVSADIVILGVDTSFAGAVSNLQEWRNLSVLQASIGRTGDLFCHDIVFNAAAPPAVLGASVMFQQAGGLVQVDPGVASDGAGGLSVASLSIGGAATVAIGPDSGWSANADGGNKAVVIADEASVAALAAALDPTNVGYGQLLADLASKVKSLETSLAGGLLPNA